MTSGPPLPHAFGRYILRARVAAGGMAEVFRATLPGFGGFEKEVAIKRMYRQYSEDASFVEMLTDEAKIVSQLHHPNIVQILDVGRVQEDYYIAFEYVDGVDLFRLLQKQFELGRDLPIAMALHIVAELCSALDYAHARRTHSGDALAIVHRDVSPQNLLIGHQGEVKLTDFGIAKAAYRFTQTQTGMIKGKLFYMSPEQARGEPIDHRSDLFAAGILLYELLCTRPLYGDGNPKELLAKVGRGEYSWPTDKKARVPMALLAVVDKALQRNAGQRYQSGREFRAALLRVADQLGLRSDREALGAYVRKIYEVTENRPPAVAPPPRAQALDKDRESAHWSTGVGDVPQPLGELDQPTTRRPERGASARGAGLPRAQRRVATAPAASLAPANAAPAVEDGVPPPLPTIAARSPESKPSDDATAMLDMTDLAARLAKAAPPAPLHATPSSDVQTTGMDPVIDAAASRAAVSRAAATKRKPTVKGAAPPRPPPGKARNPHLLRTGRHASPPPGARPPGARPSGARPSGARPSGARPGSARGPEIRPSSDHGGDSRAPRRRGGARPASAGHVASDAAVSPVAAAPSGTAARVAAKPGSSPRLHPAEASTRFIQAMPDPGSAAADTSPRTPRGAAQSTAPRAATPPPRRPGGRSATGGRPVAAPANAATRFVPAMPDSPVAPSAPLDPDLAPASWPLIGLTTAVWAGVVVLGVYSVLLLIR